MATRTPNHGGRLRLVGACYGLAIAGIALGFGLLLVLSFALLPLGINPTGVNGLVLSLVAIQGIAFPSVALLYFSVTGRSLREFIPISIPDLKESILIVVTWIGALLSVIVIGAAIIELSGTEPAQNSAAQTAADNPEFIPYLIILVFLLNAPGEELLFRGVIQGLLRERFGAAGAILLATGAFAPIHIVALIGSLQGALITISILSISSIIFGAVYEYTDNILVPTLVHGLYNATLFGSLLFSSGG